MFTDGKVRLYSADAFKMIESWPKDETYTFEHMMGDPPYDAKTHEGARTGNRDKKLIDFQAFTPDDLCRLLVLLAQHITRWAVFTADNAHVRVLERSKLPGWEFIREGIWVKEARTGRVPAPQYTGDRPGMGWEKIVFMHRVKSAHCPKHERIRWNGGGRHSVFTHAIEPGVHPTQKPVSLYGEFVRLFTDPGEEILDPMCGSATTLLAARNHGREATGIELDPANVKKAKARLAQTVLDLGGV